MSDRLITIALFQDVFDADMLRLRLATEGFNATLADEHSNVAHWGLTSGLGGIKVQVPQAEVETAKAFVEAIQAEREEGRGHDEAVDAALADLCLVCGCSIPKTQSECPDCGWTYAGSDPPLVEHEDTPSVCTRCGYSLAALGRMGNCPECGQPFGVTGVLDEADWTCRTCGELVPGSLTDCQKCSPARMVPSHRSPWKLVLFLIAAFLALAIYTMYITLGPALAGPLAVLAMIVSMIIFVMLTRTSGPES